MWMLCCDCWRFYLPMVWNILCWDLKVIGFVFLLMVWWWAPGIMDWLLAIATDLLLSQSIQTDCGTHLSILWVSGALSLGVKWLGHETDHSSWSGAMVKLSVVVPRHPHVPLWHAQWQLYPWGVGMAYWYVIRVSALWLRNCGSSKRFSFTGKLSRPDLRPTHLPIELEPGPLALRAKWPWRAAYRLFPSFAEVKNERISEGVPSPVCPQDAHRDNCTFEIICVLTV